MIGVFFNLAVPCGHSPIIHMLMLRFALFSVLHVLPLQIICYTGGHRHLSFCYVFLCVSRTKFFLGQNTEKFHALLSIMSMDWIFQQKMVSIHFPRTWGQIIEEVPSLQGIIHGTQILQWEMFLILRASVIVSDCTANFETLMDEFCISQ